MRFRVAVVQFAVKHLIPEANLRKAEQFIKKAKEHEANIIVFPEDFITGPIFGMERYVDSSGKYRDYFQELAKSYRIDVVTGSFIEAHANAWYNTSYYIDSRGKVRACYRKINLWYSERRYLAAGREIPVFNTRYGKCSLAICFDLFFPEVFRKAVMRGAKLIFCPSYWCFGAAGTGLIHAKDAEVKVIDSLCKARAFENNIALVFANAAGALRFKGVNLSLVGHSQITVPLKGSLKVFNHNKEAMFVQEIDTGLLDDAERAYRLRAELKENL
jgi:predicted amidohydrolase